MSQIDAPEDPYPVEKKLKKDCNAMDDESSMRILARADPGNKHRNNPPFLAIMSKFKRYNKILDKMSTSMKIVLRIPPKKMSMN